jgi:hypothetical protein
MIPLDSSLENTEDVFCNLHESLSKFDFCLAGNWEYSHGYLDKHLDKAHKVWVRIPFHVTEGELDGASEEQCDALIKLGKPYVFGHLYEEDVDEDAEFQMIGGLINQFQSPVESDADVNPRWVARAQAVIRKAEQEIVH